MGYSNSKKEKREFKKIKHENNLTGRKPVPVSYIKEIKKSICKIINKDKSFGTGFFMLINSYKYLITCYHVIEI